MDLLISGCEELGISLSQTQQDQFQRYYDELTIWNQKMNLTAITAYAEVQVKHFLDSLSGLPVYMEERGLTWPLASTPHAIDVGSGAGLPGIPLKIVWPQLHLTLLDGTGKKVRFLQHVIGALGLAHIQVVQGRAEEVARQNNHRGQYDLVLARAVAPLSTLAEYLLPLARRDGYVMAYKGANVAEEFMQARKAVELLGGETVRLAPVHTPHLDEGRFIVLMKKKEKTPPAYPRGQGLPRKQPLA